MRDFTLEQKAEIRDAALNATLDDIDGDRHLRFSIVGQWLDAKSTEEQLDVISSDHLCHREILSFDPDRVKEKYDMKEMSKKEFVTSGGMKCPNCRSTNIHFQPVSFGGFATVDRLYRDADCRKCSATWIEVYSLIGYRDFRRGALNK